MSGMKTWNACGMILICLSAGCSASAQRAGMAREAANAPLDPDIIKILTYYPTNPFMSFDPDGDPNPEGVRVTYYAVSARTQKGAFGDGLVRFKMYVVHDPSSDQAVGELVKTWEFTPQQAMGWRVAKKNPHLGWPYHFYLNWGDVDVYGREVRMVAEFVRRDGQVKRGNTKSIKIPTRKMDIHLIEPAPVADQAS